MKVCIDNKIYASGKEYLKSVRMQMVDYRQFKIEAEKSAEYIRKLAKMMELINQKVEDDQHKRDRLAASFEAVLDSLEAYLGEKKLKEALRARYVDALDLKELHQRCNTHNDWFYSRIHWFARIIEKEYGLGEKE